MGSSANNSAGSHAQAQASASRCCSPDSVRAGLCSSGSRSQVRKARLARSLRSAWHAVHRQHKRDIRQNTSCQHCRPLKDQRLGTPRRRSNLATVGRNHPVRHFQQSRFARAIGTEYDHLLAGGHLRSTLASRPALPRRSPTPASRNSTLRSAIATLHPALEPLRCTIDQQHQRHQQHAPTPAPAASRPLMFQARWWWSSPECCQRCCLPPSSPHPLPRWHGRSRPAARPRVRIAPRKVASWPDVR